MTLATVRPCGPLPRAPGVLPLLLGALLALAWADRPLQAQSPGAPSRAYFNAFSVFYDGEYRTALELFQAELRSGVKTAQSRWIDSICYFTMCGECYYHMGMPAQAKEQYDSALKLFIEFSDWMVRVQFTALRPAGAGAMKRVPWGTSSRRAQMGYFAEKTSIMQGRIDNSQIARTGGVVQQAVLYSIDVQEIIRCTALALRRRGQLLGPLRVHDQLTAEVLAKLSLHPGPPNHWSEVYLDLQIGVALAASGKDAQALLHLNRALLAAGQFDHPLTSTALLQLGLVSLGQGNFTAGAKYLDEATYAAVGFPDYGVLEEAFRYGAIAHFIANAKGMYPPLAPAIAWARRENLRQLQASLMLLAAENCVILGDAKDAAKFLEDAKHAIGRRQMSNGAIGARFNYANAMHLFQQKRGADGDAALMAAMKYMRGGSLWLYQVSLTDNLYTSGALTDRVAMDVYRDVLRDPQAIDWSADPMECMALLVTPHLPAMEHWFDVAWKRKEYEAALEISDRTRRHRFFSSLAYGGRVHALRWVLEAPEGTLDHRAQLNRQDLLARYPAYEQLRQQSQQLLKKLRANPVAASAADAQRAMSQDLTQLASVSAQQEALLREMAVRREAADFVFPPLRSTQIVQKSLPNGHALLAYFQAGGHLYGFLLNNQRYAYWQVGDTAAIFKRVMAVLRDMGHYEGNRELTLKELADEQWKQSAQQLLDLLLKGSQADFSQPFDELVIVPDGPLWYVPFEALEVPVERQLRSLLSRVRIRYVPTASLAGADGRGNKPTAHTAVVVGQLYGRDSEAASRAALEELARVLPGTSALPVPLPGPSSLYGALFDRLIVLDQITPPEQNAYAWAPIPIDRSKPGSSLEDWMALPWPGPEEMIFPGYHTAAENALKRASPATAGNEMFLSICGLMASGARTLLISRWRTGGQTTFDLVREFAQELPHGTAAAAWQRSVFLSANAKLNLEAEPRIKRDVNNQPPKATHPFFWAGYLLVDSAGGAKAETPPEEPVVKEKKPEPQKPAPEPVDKPGPAGHKKPRPGKMKP